MALAKGQSLESLRKDKESAEPPSPAPANKDAPTSVRTKQGNFECFGLYITTK